MVRIAFASLGCKTNQYESDALAEWFRRNGFSVVDDHEVADIYVLNTCTVTAEAERKARQLFRRYKKHNRHALIVACGCYAQRADLSDFADISVGTVGRAQIPALIIEALMERGVLKSSYRAADMPIGVPLNRQCVEVGENVTGSVEILRVPDKGIPYEELPAPAIPRETRAFLKVQDGCDNRCAYCAISLARGPSRSRKLSNIIEEAQELVAHGFSEFVLTGTNLNLYGFDFRRHTGAANKCGSSSSELSVPRIVPDAASDLADVIVALGRVAGVRRLRLGSLESELITEEFIEKIVNVESLCPSFHLSLQSGSDRVLRAMGRRDTRHSYRNAVSKLRAAFPDAGITTDLIVGFPGETRDDFEETLSFCDEIRFLRIHVFRFSSRPGTRAEKLSRQVPDSIAAERSVILRAKAAQLAEAAIRDRIGQTRDVLIEKFDSHGRAEGYTPEYIFVKGHGLSDVYGGKGLGKGSIVPMQIVGAEEQTAIARPFFDGASSYIVPRL
ncbi:MAG TPA: MiaB/RimO family radical SAM methylthiotransferase [Clostridiaceae bacterium]|nr:MiaB/RimO family radical SAM methylthiotransferase [Clostridiaceae bacterium]